MTERGRLGLRSVSGKGFLVLLVTMLLLQVEVGAVHVAASPGDWAMFHADLQHTGTTSDIVTPRVTLKWSFTTRGSVISSPAVSGGVVYIASAGGKVYAFQGTPPSPASPSAGFAFVVLGIGAGVASAVGGLAFAMSFQNRSEAVAYGGYYYCRKHRVPLGYVDGGLWCPLERRYLKT